MEGTYVSGAQTVTLDAIPRFAFIVSVSNFTDEENPTITYSNPVGEDVEFLQACISLDGSKDDVPYRDIPKTGTSYTFALTENERNTLRAATPNSNYLDAEFYIRSAIGGVDRAQMAPGRMTVVSADPAISPTITDSSAATYNLTGDRSKLVRYWSNAAITIGASAVKGASLKSQKVTCGDKSLTGNGTISGVETNSFVFTAADSRGNTAAKTVTPAFVEYIKLTCDLANSIPDANGTMTVNVSGNYYNGSFGAKNNTLKVYYRCKQTAGSFGSWQAMSVRLAGHSYSAAAEVTGLDYRYAYVFEAYAADALTTVYAASKTVKAAPVFDWSEQDFQFHVPVTMGRGALSVRLTAQADLNDVRTNGWYDWLSGSAPANAPGGPCTGSMCSMRVFSRGCACIQECCDTTSYRGCRIQRTLNDDVIGEWEWINPPMVTGYEFRTTQRYNGKPVYMQLVNFGALPASSTKSVTVAGMYYPISIVGTTSGSRSIPHANYIMVRGSSQSIEVATTIDYSNTTATLLVKYLKEAP